jgi:hypothetical protein
MINLGVGVGLRFVGVVEIFSQPQHIPRTESPSTSNCTDREYEQLYDLYK